MIRILASRLFYNRPPKSYKIFPARTADIIARSMVRPAEPGPFRSRRISFPLFPHLME
jgi:hypothetical protein